MKNNVATKKKTAKRTVAAAMTTASPDPLAIRRLAALLNCLVERLDPEDASILDPVHLDAHAAEADTAVAGWASEWPAYQKMARRVLERTLVAPATPAPLVRAKALEWAHGLDVDSARWVLATRGAPGAV